MSNSSTLATKDFFAYFVAYYPNFPNEDMMTPASAVGQLLEGVRSARRRTSDQRALHWLNLCESDLSAASNAISLGKTECVEAKVRSAREHFESFAKKRQMTTDFVAGED